MSDGGIKTGVIYSQEIETPKSYKIVAVRKDEKGTIHAYKLDSGDVITVDQAIAMCQMGQLEGVITGNSKNDTPFIRGVADGDRSNNLDNLPEF